MDLFLYLLIDKKVIAIYVLDYSEKKYQHFEPVIAQLLSYVNNHINHRHLTYLLNPSVKDLKLLYKE